MPYFTAGCSKQNKEEAPGDTFRIANTATPADLHPLGGIQFSAVYQIYDHLFWGEFESDHSVGRKPDLASSIELSNGGRTCVVHLRPNVTFHDGTKLTANDVEYSILEYGRRYNAPRSSVVFIPELKISVIDATTIRLESAKEVNWPLMLSIPVLSKAHEAGYANNFKGYVPMGSGPYKFVEYDESKKILRLEKFEGYAGRKPTFKNVEIHYFNTPEAAVMSLLQKKVDYFTHLPADEINNIGHKKNLELIKYTEPRPYMLVLNTRRPPFSDVKIRRAFSMVVDKEKLVRDPDGLNGNAMAMDAPLHFSLPVTIPTANRPDPEKAYKLLAEVGWRLKGGKLVKDGKQFEMTILFTENQRFILPTLRVLARNFEDFGISCPLKQVKHSIFLNTLNISHDFSVAFLNQNDLQKLKNANYYVTNSDINITGISSKSIDEIYEQLTFADTPPLELKRKLQDAIVELSPVIPLFYRYDFGAINIRYSQLLPNIYKEPQNLYYLSRAR